MQHPDEGTIHAWLDGALPVAEAERLDAHVAACAACAAAVAEARGLIAASSRILSSLDDVPAEVLPGGGEGGRSPERQIAALRARRAVPSTPSRRRWWRHPQFAAAAAMVLVAAGTATVLSRTSRDGGVTTGLVASDAARAPAAATRPPDAASPAERDSAAAPSRNAPAAPTAPPASERAGRQVAESGVAASTVENRARLDSLADPVLAEAKRNVAADERQLAGQVGVSAARREQMAVPPSGLQQGQRAGDSGVSVDFTRAGTSRVANEPRPAAPPLRAAMAEEAVRPLELEAARSAAAQLAGCYRLESEVPAAIGSMMPRELVLESRAAGARVDTLWFRADALPPAEGPSVALTWRPLSPILIELVATREGEAVMRVLRVSGAAPSGRADQERREASAAGITAVSRIACPPPG